MYRAVLLLCSLGSVWAQQKSDGFDELTRKTLLGEPRFLWPASATDATGNVRREDVVDLLERLFPPDAPEVFYGLSQFVFAPLDRAKPERMYLVALADSTGRATFNRIYIVWCGGRECEMTLGASNGENDLANQLVDVQKKGSFELITRERVGGSEGLAFARPIYTYKIEQLRGGLLVDVSAEFPKAFQDFALPFMAADKRDAQRIAAEITSVASGLSQDGKALDTELTRTQKMIGLELQYVQHEYRRRVLGQETAGLEEAMRWARSNGDFDTQDFGVSALESIGGDVATAELERLTHSVDGRIAKGARDALYRQQKNRLVRAKE